MSRRPRPGIIRFDIDYQRALVLPFPVLRFAVSFRKRTVKKKGFLIAKMSWDAARTDLAQLLYLFIVIHAAVFTFFTYTRSRSRHFATSIDSTWVWYNMVIGRVKQEAIFESVVECLLRPRTLKWYFEESSIDRKTSTKNHQNIEKEERKNSILIRNLYLQIWTELCLK